jgi:hypothetical protein
MDVMLKELGVRTDRNRLHWEKPHSQELGWWAGRLGCMRCLSHMSQRFIKVLFKCFLTRIERVRRSSRKRSTEQYNFLQSVYPLNIIRDNT